MKMHLHTARLASLLLIGTALIAALGGCRSYQLGSPAELTFQSIYVKPVANESYAPQTQALLSSQIREAFIQDGRLRLVTSEAEADAVLSVTLTEYNRETATRDRQDTTFGRDFDLTLEAEIALFDQVNGDVLFQDRRLSERSNAFVDNPYAPPGSNRDQGFLQAEYQAMPRITRDLAKKIADEVLSPWAPK
jgi:hypothetical protein